jgi:hypothetical protein
VVIAGPAANFLDQDLEIPVILFSWADPGLTPRTVKLIFDDSPPALSVPAIRSFFAADTDEILVPSEPLLLFERFEKFETMEEKKEFRKLRNLMKVKKQEKSGLKAKTSR